MKQFFALCFLLACASTGQAFAHAKITSTEPADGDFVASPRMLVLHFDNAVRLTALELHTVEGVSAEGTTIEGAVLNLDFVATESSRLFEIGIPAPLPPGEYFLVWRCIAADSHFSTGEFFFTVVASE